MYNRVNQAIHEKESALLYSICVFSHFLLLYVLMFCCLLFTGQFKGDCTDPYCTWDHASPR